MDKLSRKIIDAHGGLDRWKKFMTLTSRLRQGGALWPLKGQGGKLDETSVTVRLGQEWASHSPFGLEGKSSLFKPDRVEIRDAAGTLVEALDDPRLSFAGHTLETPWSEPQLAYFAGIAMWTYLNVPFLLAAPGVVTRPLGEWREKGELWQRLEVTFPPDIATHSTVQTLYVDDSGLLKRHDYDVEIAGNTPGAHYVGKYVEVQGLRFPTERRIYPRQPDGTALTAPLVVSIDLSDIHLS
ncbi:hypothetical protein M0638_24635 [Roseomonas sp. NAR14]|uniref:Uncharacterized protein n=1 Tax=Roseomonas acroporae TaxID=2937791 RepID=A0A9X2BZY5_9PROT|nr:hypothetical protein [Roseomonas acroporae]MCK8787560.1 hypothetical protein [Roseomonas acroporae]